MLPALQENVVRSMTDCLAVDLAAYEAALVFAPAEWTDAGMTNFDNTIEPGLEERLAKGGESTTHAAWEFNGFVVRAADGQFIEWVRRYHAVVCQHTAPTLRELMDSVNDAHGWD